MKAKITAPNGFRIAPQGHTVERFAAGEIVTGYIAEKAVANGAAEEILETKVIQDIETPEKKHRGRPRKIWGKSE